MNTCHFLKEISSYLDNQLSEAKKIEMDEHLKTCGMCTQELNRLRALSERLKEWHIAELDAGFDASVRDEIVAQELERGEVKMKKRTVAILVPSGVLAAILMMIVVGQFHFKGGYQGRLREASPEIGSLADRRGSLAGQKLSKDESLAIETRYSAEPLYSRGNLHEGMASPKGAYSLAARGNQGSMNFEVSKELSTPASSVAPLKSMPGFDTPPYGPVIVVQPVLPATGEGEKIIRTAEVMLEVGDGRVTYNKLSDICKEFGGYLGSSRFYKDKEGRESGTILMRIPKDNFLTVLDKIAELGKVEDSGTFSQDVSQQYSNLRAELDAAMIIYNKMLEALQKRQVTIPDAIKLESELTPVLKRVEALKNKLEALNNQISLTTIAVHFHEPQVSAKVLKDTREYVKDRLLTARINAIKFLVDALPAVIMFVVFALVIAGIVTLVVIWLKGLFKRS